MSFRFIRPDRALLLSVGHFAVFRYFVVWDEEYSVCRGNAAEATLCQAVEVVGVRAFPYFSVGSAHQRGVFFRSSGYFVDDGVGLVRVYCTLWDGACGVCHGGGCKHGGLLGHGIRCWFAIVGCTVVRHRPVG